MSVIKIRKAERQGARLVIGLAGQSGDGKTKTALLLAYGLANFDASKVGFLDSENKRGSLYADALKDENGVTQQFLIGDLEPPFTPARYSEAIKLFQEAGVEVLVIDSVTHEYEGTGGILEMREPLPGSAAKRDNFAKAEHKKFMNTLLQSDMHIIACIRAREKVIIDKQGGRTVYVPQGVQPVCEKNFMFELTASLMMKQQGRAQEVIKCPEELLTILGRQNGYIGSADGKALREWVDGGAAMDAEFERVKSDLKLACEGGMKALHAAWTSLSTHMKARINQSGGIGEYKASAEEYDRLRTVVDDSTAGLDELNNAILKT